MTPLADLAQRARGLLRRHALDLLDERGLIRGMRYTTVVDRLLADSDVDRVVISTPHHLHAELAIAAAGSWKHVVVEKPMANRVSDCDRMIAAAAKRGVRISVCYSQRFDRRVQVARQLIAAGVLGDPLGTRLVSGQQRDPEYWTSGLTAGRAARARAAAC